MVKTEIIKRPNSKELYGEYVKAMEQIKRLKTQVVRLKSKLNKTTFNLEALRDQVHEENDWKGDYYP